MIKTTATDKIFTLKKRVRGVGGGTGASKTISILLWMIQRAMLPKYAHELQSVVSESFPHLKRGVIRDFQNIMEEHGYWKESEYNRTDCIYTFPTGSKIEFFSADQPGKVRGPRRDILFINEANNISYEIFTQLEVRTKKIIWLDWNPVQEYWFYTEVKGKPDVDFLTLTYKDNEALDKGIVAAIESRMHNKNWWKIYGLGELGDAEGKIYKDWQLIDNVPHEARLERRGLDFGYSNDPSALVDIYYYNGGYILDEQLYQKGMSNKQISDLIVNLEYPSTMVVADCAEPKSIDEIRTYGVNVIPVVKGKDSVTQGIQFVQDQRISVTKRSVNLLKEYRNYLWETDREGKIINEPSPIFNHCFTGDTRITTDNGLKRIDEVKKGDFVFTSKGYMPVLKRWYNGFKPVNKYYLQFGMFDVMIEATPDHLVRTNKGWKKISRLQSGMTIYLNSYLWGKYFTYTQKKGTSQEEIKECTPKSGDSIMERFQKAFIFTTLTRIHGIIDQVISKVSKTISISQNMEDKDLLKMRNLQRRFNKQVSKRLDYGIVQMMVENGILNTPEINGQKLLLNCLNAYGVETLTKQDTEVLLNTVMQTAKLKHLEVEKGKKKRVYDLTVKGCHEYFANGVLVHNCMDAIRYGFDALRKKDDSELEIPNDTKLFNQGFY